MTHRSSWLTFRVICESGLTFTIKARSYREAHRIALRKAPLGDYPAHVL